MKTKNEIVILAGWALDYVDSKYYIPNTHYAYVDYLCNKYNNVILISNVKEKSFNDKKKVILNFSNIQIEPIPYYKSFKEAIFKILYFYRAIKKYKNIPLFYCRVPDPFSWMPALLFRKKCIMHFVGDSIEVILKNQNWSYIKKVLNIALYYPDYLLTIIASKRSRVFTNGFHIANKLKRFKIESTPVISSTLKNEDFCSENIKGKNDTLQLVYLGYIRYSKGIKTIMKIINTLFDENIRFHFNIIGDGEMLPELISFLNDNNLKEHATLYGHLEDRAEINKILRNSDLFVFTSLSEGSPRVILEAMAQKIPVLTTPVGSLPYVFTDKKNIRFFEFNNENEVIQLIKEFEENKSVFVEYAENAFDLVKKEYTRDNFLYKIFEDET